MKNTYLSFIVGNEIYAVNVFKVLEVLEKQNISRVPNAPKHIRGIVNFRGDIVPVFESREKFNLEAREIEDSFVIIVLDLSNGSGNMRIGAVVDKVNDVLEIDDTQIKEVPHISNNFDSRFLNGIYKLNNKFIMLLDVEKVFTDTEIQTITAML